MLEIVPIEQIPPPQQVKNADISSQNALDNLAILGCSLIEVALLNKKALGVSAVQCGIPLRAFVMRSQSPFEIEETLFGLGTQENTYSMYVNCSYVQIEGIPKELTSIEGCLSLPWKYYRVKRYPIIGLTGYLIGPDVETGKIISNLVSMVVDNPYDAVVYQHEIQHQEGILISDIGELYEK